MRGGTSKGLYLLAADLPADPGARDDLLLRVMGSGHPQQIDGLGGSHPLSSKVAVVSPSRDEHADVDYLFLQLGVDEPTVSDAQNCGNLLAGVGAFAVERGLVVAGPEHTELRVRMLNSNSVVTATIETPGGVVNYAGTTAVAGVPGPAARVVLRFADLAGSATGALLPTGDVATDIDGITVTCVDNGMPVVVARARDFGISGYESVDDLAADGDLSERVQRVRIEAGRLMGLGDVRGSSVPKTTLVAPPRDGGSICTRTFIPMRLHAAIGVLGAVSVATALLIPGAVGADLLLRPATGPGTTIDVEHPSGHLLLDVDVDASSIPPTVRSAGVIRTARKLFDGTAFPAAHPVSEFA